MHVLACTHCISNKKGQTLDLAANRGLQYMSCVVQQGCPLDFFLFSSTWKSVIVEQVSFCFSMSGKFFK